MGGPVSRRRAEQRSKTAAPKTANSERTPQVRQRVTDQDGARRKSGDQRLRLGQRQPVVQGSSGRAELPAREVAGDRLPPVRQPPRDDVALTYAVGGEAGRESGSLVRHVLRR